MDWRLAVEAERAMPMRIAALLVALADLADMSSSRSRAVRGLVLWLLLPAETLVREFVTGAPALIPLRHGGNTPADAIRLAASLRSLAAALLDLPRQALSCADEPDCLPGEHPGVATLGTALTQFASMALRASRRTPHDTS